MVEVLAYGFLAPFGLMFFIGFYLHWKYPTSNEYIFDDAAIQNAIDRFLAEGFLWLGVATIVLTMAFFAALLLSVTLLLKEPLRYATTQDWFILLAVPLGVALYWLRRRLPLAYGLIEVLFAMATMWLAIELQGVYLARGGALIAAIYVFVRGIDNIERGLPARVRPYWDRVFPPMPTQASVSIAR